MSHSIIAVPDLGTTEPVEIIEVLVNEGDQIEQEQILVVIETEKASVEVPADKAGVVSKLLVEVGSKLKEGEPILELQASEAEAPATEPAQEQKPEAPVEQEKPEPAAEEAAPVASDGGTQLLELLVPDIGDDASELIELPIKVGDKIQKEDIVAVLESDKATIEIPSEYTGEVEKVDVAVGAKLSQGDVIAHILVAGAAPAAAVSASNTEAPTKTPSKAEMVEAKSESMAQVKPAAAQSAATQQQKTAGKVYAGPAVRKLARDMGVELSEVKGSGPKGRVLKEDLYAQVKDLLSKQSQAPAGGGGLQLDLPEIDFSQFGPIEEVELNKLRKVSAKNLHRSWLTIPHVTQFDEADITEMEAFRKSMNAELQAQGVKLTPLAFLLKACAKVLEAFPNFRSSLSIDGERLYKKDYFHIGVAVDTPNGLVVPVIRDVDKKGIAELAEELGVVSAKARDRKLMPADMQGAVFSISSLGGIGGTAFTPIVNWPEVAILGVSKSKMAPVYNGSDFEPRLMLPLSLSYDHRVIDGADAARFTSALSAVLSDIRRLSV